MEHNINQTTLQTNSINDVDQGSPSIIDSVYNDNIESTQARIRLIKIISSVVIGLLFIGLLVISYQKGALISNPNTASVTVPVVSPPTVATRIKPPSVKENKDDLMIYESLTNKNIDISNSEVVSKLPINPSERITDKIIEVYDQDTVTQSQDRDPLFVAKQKLYAASSNIPNYVPPRRVEMIKSDASASNRVLVAKTSDNSFSRNTIVGEKQSIPPQQIKTVESSDALPFPQSVIGGDYYVQLGSFASENKALQAWATFRNKYQDVIGDSGRFLQDVRIKDKTFYRLKTGAWNKNSDATTICNAIKSRGGDCIVTR